MNNPSLVASTARSLIEQGDGGSYVDLALDSKDRVHLVYSTGSAGLRHTMVDHGQVFKTTADVGGVGTHNSLVIDGNDRPQVAYYDHAEARLEYAEQTCDQ